MLEPSSVAPWEQHAGESARAFGAFCVYRDQGPRRSLRAAAAAFYGHTSAARERQFDKWSRVFHWVARASAWDQHLDAEARQAQEEAQREMTERHVKEARALQGKALERLRALRPEELGPADVLRYLVEAVKLERLALGEPETVAETRSSPVILHIVEEIVGGPAAAAVANITPEVSTHDHNAPCRNVLPNHPSASGPAGLPAQ
jgi:hypothetical protein